MLKILIVFFQLTLQQDRFTYLPRCNTYKNLNRRNSMTSIVVDNVLEIFFQKYENYGVKLDRIKENGDRAIKAFCEEEI